jgi:hypothetical protein
MKRIPLSKTYTLANQERDYVEMREPCVRDNLNVSKIKEEEQREITLLANLCDISTDDIEALTLSDYSRLSHAFLGFIGLRQPNLEPPLLH